MIHWMVAYPFQHRTHGSGLMPCQHLAGLTVDKYKLDPNVQRLGGPAATARSVPGTRGGLFGGIRRLRCLRGR